MDLKFKHVIEHVLSGGRLRCLDDDKRWYYDEIKIIFVKYETIETKEGCSVTLSDFGEWCFMVKDPLSDENNLIENNFAIDVNTL